MKKVLVILLSVFSCLTANSQTTLDTVYFTVGSYITTGTTPQKSLSRTRIRKYDNGNEQQTTDNLGDSLLAQDRVLNEYLNEFRMFSFQMISALNMKPNLMKTKRQLDANLKRVGYPSINDLVQARYEGNLIGKVLVRVNQDSLFSGDIIKNNQSGNLRLLFLNKGYRVEIMSDNVININDYPIKGEDTWLYMIRNDVYISEDRKLILNLNVKS